MSDEYFSAQAAPPVDGAAPPVWELSGWWRRVGAQFIDVLLVSFPIGIVVAIVDAPGTVNWLANLIGLTIYFLATMTAWNGQTVGKKFTGIRVVREGGEPIDAKFVFVRQTLVMELLFGTLGVFLLLIPTLLNYLWPLWDDKHQALHDKIVHSRVVREQPATDPGTLQVAQQQQTVATAAAPFPVAPQTPPPPAGPPAPPTPGGTSTPYTPPTGFENPVPDDEK